MTLTPQQLDAYLQGLERQIVIADENPHRIRQSLLQEWRKTLMLAQGRGFNVINRDPPIRLSEPSEDQLAPPPNFGHAVLCACLAITVVAIGFSVIG